MPDPTDMVIELLSYGGRLWVDSVELPVTVTVSTAHGTRNFYGGSISSALSMACRSLKTKPQTEDANG